MRNARVRFRRRGAALLDLVVVASIIALLVALVIPMLLTARDRSNRFRCADHLRDVGRAIYHYAADHHGRFPSTRPSTLGNMLPDCSNSGAASADPFGPDGPGPNNVPAAMFLLVRSERLRPESLICPATKDVPDRFGGLTALQRSNFTDVDRNLSYSLQNPYADEAALASGFTWSKGDLPASFVLAADRNPGLARSDDLPALSPTVPPSPRMPGNSPNHGRKGQNVLYADGRVEFMETSLAGVRQDNIYLTRRGALVDSPQDATDNILLPYAKREAP